MYYLLTTDYHLLLPNTYEVKVYLEPGSPICNLGLPSVVTILMERKKSSIGEHQCYDPWVGKGSTIATTQGEGRRL